MSVTSRLSGKEYPQLGPFISDLQAGVNEDIETVAVPIRADIQEIKNRVGVLENIVIGLQSSVSTLQSSVSNLQSSVTTLQNTSTTPSTSTEGTTEGGTTSGGTTSTATYNVVARWTGGVGLPTIPITITVNGTSFTLERESSVAFIQQAPSGARVTVSTPYLGIWAEGQINPTVVASDTTSYTFTISRDTTLTVSLQPQ